MTTIEMKSKARAKCGTIGVTQADASAKTDNGVLWPETTQHGHPRQRSQQNIQAFLAWRGVKLSMNSFSMRCFAEIDGAEVPIDDDILRRLRLEADALGLAAPEKFFDDVIINSATANAYHPPRDYLAQLKWDKKPRLYRWLTTYVGAEDPPLHRAWARIHLCAAVRRLRCPGAKHDAMLVFEGRQGTGKSTAIRKLGDQWFNDSLMLGDGPKEIIEQTSGAWLIEFAELNGIRGRALEQIKAMISRQSDRARLAWGRHAVDRPRQFVLFGTTNNSHYLHDSTGDRRFWTVKVGKIDLEGLRGTAINCGPKLATMRRQRNVSSLILCFMRKPRRRRKSV